MNQISNVQSLSQVIKQRHAEDQKQIEQLTQRELQRLEKSLQQQSSAALSTTEAAIQQIQQQINDVSKSAGILKTTTDKQRQQLAAANQKQIKLLETQMKAEAKRLAWLLRLPILAALIVCLLICLSAWAWWRLSAPYQIQETEGGQRWQVMKDKGWRMCGQQPCRPLNP